MNDNTVNGSFGLMSQEEGQDSVNEFGVRDFKWSIFSSLYPSVENIAHPRSPYPKSVPAYNISEHCPSTETKYLIILNVVD